MSVSRSIFIYSLQVRGMIMVAKKNFRFSTFIADSFKLSVTLVSMMENVVDRSHSSSLMGGVSIVLVLNSTDLTLATVVPSIAEGFEIFLSGGKRYGDAR